MDSDYSVSLVLAIITNREQIESFLESTTAVLTPFQYEVAPKDMQAFMQQEGHTLWYTGSRTTNVPSKGGMRENLIMWLADIDSALTFTLNDEEKAAVIRRAFPKQGKESPRQAELADAALDKMVRFLNEGYAAAV